MWLLGQLSDATCNDVCKGRMFLLERIRLAMGKNQRRVSVALITPKQEVIDQYDTPVIAPLNCSAMVVQNDALVVVDPQGRVVMSYSKDVDPRNITSDFLKKLLKVFKVFTRCVPEIKNNIVYLFAMGGVHGVVRSLCKNQRCWFRVS